MLFDPNTEEAFRNASWPGRSEPAPVLGLTLLDLNDGDHAEAARTN